MNSVWQDFDLETVNNRVVTSAWGQDHLDSNLQPLDRLRTWLQLLPRDIIAVLRLAENQDLPFMPPDFTPDILATPNQTVPSVNHLQVVCMCMYLAMEGQEFQKAAALLYLADRALYRYGNSKPLLKVAEYLQATCPNVALAPQVTLRGARVRKDEGDLNGALKVIHTIISREDGWSYKDERQYQDTKAACLHVQGQIYHTLELWPEAVGPLVEGYRLFQQVRDLKGLASVLHVLSLCLRRLQPHQYQQLRRLHPDVFSSDHPCLEGYRQGQTAVDNVQHILQDRFFVAKHQLVADEALLMYAVQSDCPFYQHCLLQHVLDDLTASLASYGSLRGLQNLESCLEFVRAVFTASLVMATSRCELNNQTARFLEDASLQLFKVVCRQKVTNSGISSSITSVSLSLDEASVSLMNQVLAIFGLPALHGSEDSATRRNPGPGDSVFTKESSLCSLIATSNRGDGSGGQDPVLATSSQAGSDSESSSTSSGIVSGLSQVCSSLESSRDLSFSSSSGFDNLISHSFGTVSEQGREKWSQEIRIRKSEDLSTNPKAKRVNSESSAYSTEFCSTSESTSSVAQSTDNVASIPSGGSQHAEELLAALYTQGLDCRQVEKEELRNSRTFPTTRQRTSTAALTRARKKPDREKFVGLALSRGEVRAATWPALTPEAEHSLHAGVNLLSLTPSDEEGCLDDLSISTSIGILETGRTEGRRENCITNEHHEDIFEPTSPEAAAEEEAEENHICSLCSDSSYSTDARHFSLVTNTAVFQPKMKNGGGLNACSEENTRWLTATSKTIKTINTSSSSISADKENNQCYTVDRYASTEPALAKHAESTEGGTADPNASRTSALEAHGENSEWIDRSVSSKPRSVNHDTGRFAADRNAKIQSSSATRDDKTGCYTVDRNASTKSRPESHEVNTGCSTVGRDASTKSRSETREDNTGCSTVDRDASTKSTSATDNISGCLTVDCNASMQPSPPTHQSLTVSSLVTMSARRRQVGLGTLQLVLKSESSRVDQLLASYVPCDDKQVYRAVMQAFNAETGLWTAQTTLAYVGDALPLTRDKPKGAFRDACLVRCLHQGDPLARYVGKRYRKQQSIEVYRHDVIQQMIASYYVTAFNQALTSYPGEVLRIHFLPAFHLQLLDKDSNKVCDWLNMEPYMEGRYRKLTNNAGHCCSDREAQLGLEAATAFSHFSHTHSRGRHMVVDLQGCVPDETEGVIYLTDPILHTRDRKSRQPGDRHETGMAEFFRHVHATCNKVCQFLNIDTQRPTFSKPNQNNTKTEAEL